MFQLSHSRLFKQIKLTPPCAEVQQHGLGYDGYVRDVDIVREVTGRIFVRPGLMSHHRLVSGCHTTGSGQTQRDGVRTRVSISVVSHDSCLHGSVHLCCDHVSPTPTPMPMWPILGFNVDYVSLVQRTHAQSLTISGVQIWTVAGGGWGE